MINTGCSDPISVTSSNRVNPSAANAVATPETKNAPAPTSNAIQRNADTSCGQKGALSLRRERQATIAASGGNASHNLQVVNTSASEWPARTNNELADHSPTATRIAAIARCSTGIARERLARSTTRATYPPG